MGFGLPSKHAAWLDYTKSIGGSIAAAEFMNEPTFAAMGGAPKATMPPRMLAICRLSSVRETGAPGMTILGPGGVGEGGSSADRTARET